MLRKVLGLILISFLVIIGTNAGADEVPVAREEWEPLSAGPITTWTAPVCAKGEFVVQPFFFYNRTRGIFDEEGHYASLPSGSYQYQYQEILFVQYGLTDRLEFDLQLAHLNNYVKDNGLKAHARGLGDSVLFLRYCALEEKSWVPHTTGLLQLKIPSGKYQKVDPEKLGADIMGSGSYDPGFGVVFSKKIKPFLLHSDLAYNIPIERKIDGVKTRYGNYLNYDFGLEYFLPKGFNLMLEFNGLLSADTEQNGYKIPDSDSRSFAITAGIGWSCERIQALLGYQRSLAGLNSDANDSAIVTFVYAF